MKKPKWKFRRMGSGYDWVLKGQHPTLLTALAGRGDPGDKESLELHVFLDPRTGKQWAGMEAMREWMNKAMSSMERQ